MATEITIPQLGESISEAVVASWLRADGEYVERDEEIVELETDKVTMPLPAPAAGVLKHGAAEGDTVEVGSSLGTIDESAEKPAGGDGAAKAQSQKQQGGSAQSGAEKKAGAAVADTPAASSEAPQGSPDAKVEASHASEHSDATSGSTGDHASAGHGGRMPSGDNVRATPVARKLAEQFGVDLHAVMPTGPGRRIREQDVLAVLQAQRSARSGSANGAAANGRAASASATTETTAGPSREVRRERMSQLRRRVAVRLVEAQQTAAMLTTFNECDMTNVMALRSKHKDAFLDKHGVKLGFMSFFAKAAVSALQRVPNVNAFIVQGEKSPEVEHHDYCDIAFAVGTDKGLVVPVLRNVESKSFAEIESGLGELAKKAREGKLTLDEMQGGTFTISNGGVYGSMLSTPILNPPQSGILGMHNIIRRPIEHPEKPGEMALRPMMYLALSYDHRIVDGEGAVTFLKHIKECIESPERLLLGM